MAEDNGFRSSCMSNEVRSTVVAAVLAVRAAPGLPSWRVRSVCWFS